MKVRQLEARWSSSLAALAVEFGTCIECAALPRSSSYTIRAMRITTLLLLLLISVLQSEGQVLSRTEYSDLLDKIEATAPNWQKSVDSLDIDRLNVSYQLGKTIEG